MKELWKNIKNYEGLYQVSNLGRVKSFPRAGTQTKRERILKQSTSKAGYNHVSLCKDNIKTNKLVHRLVAEVFIDNPNNLSEINHKNEIKNDNRVENLEWCTSKYNNCYGTRIDRVLIKTSKKVKQYDLNHNFIKIWDSISEAERALHTGKNISEVCKGKKKTAGGYMWEYAD